MTDHNLKKVFTSSFMPRFSDFDLQGILNSKQYLDLLVEARFDQMARCYNHPIEYYLKKNQHWVVSTIKIDFLSPLYPGKIVNISTCVFKIEGPKAFVEFSFETSGSSGATKVHAKGNAEYVLIDLRTKSPVDISEEEKSVFL